MFFKQLQGNRVNSISKEKALAILRKVPSWLLVTVGVLVLIIGFGFFGARKPSINFLPDGSCQLRHNDHFSFPSSYHIKWGGNEWVDTGSGKPVDVSSISYAYGNSSVKHQAQGIRIDKDRPRIKLAFMSSFGDITCEEIYFLKAGEWWIAGTLVDGSEKYSDFVADRIGPDGEYQ